MGVTEERADFMENEKKRVAVTIALKKQKQKTISCVCALCIYFGPSREYERIGKKEKKAK